MAAVVISHGHVSFESRVTGVRKRLHGWYVGLGNVTRPITRAVAAGEEHAAGPTNQARGQPFIAAMLTTGVLQSCCQAVKA